LIGEDEDGSMSLIEVLQTSTNYTARTLGNLKSALINRNSNKLGDPVILELSFKIDTPLLTNDVLILDFN
jgi:hypothetical protein